MHHSKLPEIIAQLLEIHNTKKVQVHITFMGHVNKFEVDVFIPNWVPDKTPDLTFGGYIDRDGSWNNFEKEISAFIKLFNTLNS
jgi:hypothetical protein